MIDLLRARLSCTPMGGRLFGGGGGDDGYAAAQAALKASQDTAITNVNQVFGVGSDPTSAANAASRSSLYDTIKTDSENQLLNNLGLDRTKAERNVRFQLARQGLGGGSADVDQNADLLTQYQKGSLEANNSAIAAGNSARSADEQTRVGLINNIRNGMSQADAITAADSAQVNNANTARDTAMATNIGGFFDNLGILNNKVAYNNGLQQTLVKNPYATGGSVVSPATSGGFGGRITG